MRLIQKIYVKSIRCSLNKKTLDKKSNSVKLKTMKQTYDIIKDSHLVAPTYHWMLNGYAKHTELTQEL